MVELEVVTPSRRVLHTEAESLIVPSTEGYLGIMHNHAPLVAGLTAGVLHYGTAGGAKEQLAISGGFLEVTDNKVTVLADAAELSGEIDVLRAQEARKRAEHRLKTRDERIDYARAELAMQRALIRLQAAGVELPKQ